MRNTNNIYASPKDGTEIRVFNAENGVTERMVSGLLRANPWAKYMSWLTYLYTVFFGVITVICFFMTMFNLFGIVASSVLGMAISEAQAFVFGIVCFVCLLFFTIYAYRMAKAMRDYARTCEQLQAAPSMARLEKCHALFTTYNRYYAYSTAIGIAFVLVFLIFEELGG